MEIVVEFPCRTVTPGLEKIAAREGGRLAAASQIFLMTGWRKRRSIRCGLVKLEPE